ncbi:MAG: CPBP family glutamic-type intramembrane protease [Candidatus Acidiferrales bacterium]
MRHPIRRLLDCFEVLLFLGFTAWFIWRLEFTHRNTWLIFPAWFAASFLLHRDTPKTIGWRADNLRSSSLRAAPVFAIFIVTVTLTGLAIQGLNRPAFHLLSMRRLVDYFAFCLLQQVALSSFLVNRLLFVFSSRHVVSLTAGLVFAALHWPNPVLVPLTFIGGTAMAFLFATDRNIIPLAVGQTILGTLVWWAFPIAWHHALRVGPAYYWPYIP